MVDSSSSSGAMGRGRGDQCLANARQSASGAQEFLVCSVLNPPRITICELLLNRLKSWSRLRPTEKPLDRCILAVRRERNEKNNRNFRRNHVAPGAPGL